MIRILTFLLLFFIYMPATVRFSADEVIKASDKRFGIFALYVSDKISDVLKTLNAGFVRMDFRWDDIEPRKPSPTGKHIYNWEKHDKIIKVLVKKNIKILALVSWQPKWVYQSKRQYVPPSEIDNFVAFAKALVKRYKPHGELNRELNGALGDYGINHWEIWNEPDLDFYWNGSDEEYVNLLQKTYPEIKAKDPNSIVLIGGLSGSVNFAGSKNIKDTLNKYYKLGIKNYFDMMNFHFYPEKENPKRYLHYYDREGYDHGILQRIKDIKQVMYANNDVKPIWNSETGLGLSLAGLSLSKTEEIMSEYLLRIFVIQFAEGIEKVFWFSLFMDNPPYNSANLVHIEQGKHYAKPAFYTYKMLAENLSGFNRAELVFNSNNILIYKFNKRDKTIYVAWWDYWNEPNLDHKTIDLSNHILSPRIKKTPIVTKLDIRKKPVLFHSKSEPTDSVTIDKTPIFIERME